VSGMRIGCRSAVGAVLQSPPLYACRTRVPGAVGSSHGLHRIVGQREDWLHASISLTRLWGDEGKRAEASDQDQPFRS
jgi:hypothetical protein